MGLGEIILDILLPRKCLGCGREGRYVCDKCEVFLSEVPFSKEVFSVWEYEGLMEKLIEEIKYQGKYHIIDELVQKTLQKIELNLPEDIYITYVPMHKKKKKERGFNQAELIAKKVGEITSKKVLKLLEKTRDNQTQVGLSPKERLENVKGAFSLLTSDFNKSLAPRNVLLIDDVYTTGATAKECIKVLKKGGVKNVWVFTLARKLKL